MPAAFLALRESPERWQSHIVRFRAGSTKAALSALGPPGGYATGACPYDETHAIVYLGPFLLGAPSLRSGIAASSMTTSAARRAKIMFTS